MIAPHLTITQALTHSSRGGDDVEAVTTVAPGIRVSSRAGRVQGAIDYSLLGVMYARDSSASRVQHQLAASASAEAIRDHLYVDARASVSRQPISAFGLQSTDPTLATRNYSQVSTLSVSPVLRGTLAGVVNLSAGATFSSTDTGTGSISDSSARSAFVSASSATVGARVGWGLSATRNVVEFDQGRRSEEDRLIGSLNFSLSPELQVNVRAGVEDSNLASLTQERTDTWGAGFVWLPTERTRISADADRRAFGHSHAFEFQHRMRRLVWRVADRQDVTQGADARGALIPAFDLFYALFASQVPDPVLREELVNSLLQSSNLSPGQLVNGGFLTGTSALARRQEVSLAIEGIRTTYLLSAFNSSSRRAFDLLRGTGDLALGAVEQRGLTASVSRRVTPTASLSVFASTLRSSSDASNQRGRLNSISANWSEQLRRRVSLTLGARHSRFEGTAESTYDTTLSASVRMTF